MFVAGAGDARYQALPRALAGAAAFQTAVSKLVYDVLMIKARIGSTYLSSILTNASCDAAIPSLVLSLYEPDMLSMLYHNMLTLTTLQRAPAHAPSPTAAECEALEPLSVRDSGDQTSETVTGSGTSASSALRRGT